MSIESWRGCSRLSAALPLVDRPSSLTLVLEIACAASSALNTTFSPRQTLAFSRVPKRTCSPARLSQNSNRGCTAFQETFMNSNQRQRTRTGAVAQAGPGAGALGLQKALIALGVGIAALASALVLVLVPRPTSFPSPVPLACSGIETHESPEVAVVRHISHFSRSTDDIPPSRCA